MRKTKIVTGALFGALASGLLTVGHFSNAQVPSANPPFNIDLGGTPTTSTPLITNTARGPSTVNSTQQQNLDKSGVLCTFNQTAQGGAGPQLALAIQNYDSASGQYYTIATTTPSSPNNNVPVTVLAHDGAQTSSLPAGITAAFGIPLARFWRVQEILTGGAVTTTGTVGCVIVK